MAVELQIIRAREFVSLDADEHLDFEASKEALQSLAEACVKRGLERAMLDLRDIPAPPKPMFTPTQLAALVRTFWQAGFGSRQRLAVLYREDPYGGARLFAFIGRIHGWQVRAFTDFEEAFLWLSKQRDGPCGFREDEVPIPITIRRNEIKNMPIVQAAIPRGHDTRRRRSVRKRRSRRALRRTNTRCT
jgi:hypothetical protein